jgi:SWI/SNF-related matrix-associated actin-dependent regulator of chromatin subfamily A member 5
LRLDALVIQQGRLVENTKSVNKDDLLSMVRYGAEMVFSSAPSKITDEDIDAIIQKGERSTAELNNKLQNFTDDAMKFTMDGGMSAYEFEEKKEEENNDQIDQLKALMGANWVDPPKRERKRIVSYAENQTARKDSKPSGPRVTKMPNLPDYQFYDIERLSELYGKIEAYELHLHSIQQKESSLKQQGASEEAIAEAIAPKDDDPQPLTEEEDMERELLLTQGFSNWNKRDFTNFTRACERHGRDNLDLICKEVEGKTEDEVRKYAAVFNKRGKTALADWERVSKNIERGEQKIQWQASIMDAIAKKLAKCKNPWQDLKIQYGPSKGKAYNEEEDRFLVCMMHQLGYGAWDELKAAIRNSWRFRFDWFIKSRTPAELARRCDTLIRLIEKESEGDDGKKKTGDKRRASSGADSKGDETKKTKK